MIRDALAVVALSTAVGCVASLPRTEPPESTRASTRCSDAQGWRQRTAHGDLIALVVAQRRVEIEPVVAWELALPALETTQWLPAFEYDAARARFVVDERVTIDRNGAMETPTLWYRRSAATPGDARRGSARAPTETGVLEHVWFHPGGGFTALSRKDSDAHAEECGTDSFSITATDGRRGRQITFAGSPKAAAFAADGSLLVSTGRARGTAYELGPTNTPAKWSRGDRTVRVAPDGAVSAVSGTSFDEIAGAAEGRVWGVRQHARAATLFGMQPGERPSFRKHVEGRASEPLPTLGGACFVIERRLRGPSPELLLQCWRLDGTLQSSRELPRRAAVLVTPDGTTFVGTARGLASYDADGRELWRVPLAISSALTLNDRDELCAISQAPRRLVCLRARASA